MKPSRFTGERSCCGLDSSPPPTRAEAWSRIGGTGIQRPEVNRHPQGVIVPEPLKVVCAGDIHSEDFNRIALGDPATRQGTIEVDASGSVRQGDDVRGIPCVILTGSVEAVREAARLLYQPVTVNPIDEGGADVNPV